MKTALKLLKIGLDLALLGFALAVIGALAGGFRFQLFGVLRISAHDPLRPLYQGLGVLAIRLFVSCPPGLSFGQKVDYWIERVADMGRLAVRPDGAPRRLLYPLFRGLGIKVPGTESSWNGARLAAVLMVPLAIWLVASPTYRYFNAGQLIDMTIFLEAMHSASQGEGFLNTGHYCQFHTVDQVAAAANPKMHMFGSHFRPGLYLLVPLYWLVPGAITMFVLQALLVTSSVWPLYKLAREKLDSEPRAMFLTLIYCLYPGLLMASLAFFPGVLAIAGLMWAFWFHEKKRYVWMLVFLLLTISVKELLALPLMSFGAYVFFFGKKRALGSAIAVVALAWLVVSLYWVIPAYSPGEKFGHMWMYEPLGGSLREVAGTLITRPHRALPYVFSLQTFWYLGGLLLPVALLPLVGWRVWILCLPVFAQNILTGEPGEQVWYRLPTGIWSAGVIPFTFVAVLRALDFVKERYGERRLRQAFVVLGIGALLGLTEVSLIPHNGIWSNPYEVQAIDALHEAAPAGATVSTNAPNVYMRGFHQYEVRMFPNGIDEADWVLLTLPPEGPTIVSAFFATQERFLTRVRDSGKFRRIWSVTDPRPRSSGIYVIYARKKG